MKRPRPRLPAVLGVVTPAGRSLLLVALVCYAAAGAVMLTTTWPGPLAALVALLYIATVWPFRSITDETAERATAGWRRFLWINQIAGFIVTLLLIWYWLLTS